MAYLSQDRGFLAQMEERFTTSLSDLRARMAARRIYNRTYAELAKLTDRELADINISRANLRSVAYEAAYGE